MKYPAKRYHQHEDECPKCGALATHIDEDANEAACGYGHLWAMQEDLDTRDDSQRGGGGEGD